MQPRPKAQPPKRPSEALRVWPPRALDRAAAATRLRAQRCNARAAHDVLLVREVPGVRALDALAQWDARVPTEGVQTRDIEELARRAVGLGRVEGDRALEPHDIGDQRGELT